MHYYAKIMYICHPNLPFQPHLSHFLLNIPQGHLSVRFSQRERTSKRYTWGNTSQRIGLCGRGDWLRQSPLPKSICQGCCSPLQIPLHNTFNVWLDSWGLQPSWYIKRPSQASEGYNSTRTCPCWTPAPSPQHASLAMGNANLLVVWAKPWNELASSHTPCGRWHSDTLTMFTP